jgi:hypothetical protein
MAINTTDLPDLGAIVDPLLGLPYEQFDCWRLCRHLYREGWGEDLDDDPVQAWKHIQEMWWQDDVADPCAVSQPWDVWILRGRGMASHHTAIVVNQTYFVHTRKRIGVCLEPMVRWKPRLLQIARLRRLA